jgi:hypothetical protein
MGGHGQRFRPRTAHTWATYVKATPNAPLEQFTISWLPVSRDVRPSRFRPEPGANLTLQQTLDLMITGNHRVSLWGPFEIPQYFYEESQNQKAFLDSGAVKYRVINAFDRSPYNEHCVHAIVRADPALERATRPIIMYGEAVSQRVANGLAKTGIVAQPNVTHDWLIPALDLERYKLRRAPVGQPGLVHLLPRR